MISIDTSFADNGICDMRAMLDDEAQFGPKCLKMDYQLHEKVMKTGFEEAPWLYKIGDTYFLLLLGVCRRWRARALGLLDVQEHPRPVAL